MVKKTRTEKIGPFGEVEVPENDGMASLGVLMVKATLFDRLMDGKLALPQDVKDRIPVTQPK